MNNFRDTKSKNDCTKCKDFCSWNSFMGDDDQHEPNDEGRCENDLNLEKDDNLCCGRGEVCDLFKKY